MNLHRDVVVLRWPQDAPQLHRLASEGQPRLLLVEAGADPPESIDCEQDWVRLPADERDIGARLAGLTRRAARHHGPPALDAHGRVHHRGMWVATSPIERRLAGVLLARFGSVVNAGDLSREAWPDDPPNANTLRVHVTRLKKRLVPLGLDIRGVRPAGYVLQNRIHDDGAGRPG